jgi:hypothetical protein
MMTMDRNQAAKRWAEHVASFVTDGLLSAGLLAEGDNVKAVAVIEDEILARLKVSDYPPRAK